MEKHKEYLNKFLVEADVFSNKESTPDAPVVLKLDKDYKANAEHEYSDVGEELKSIKEDDYVAQTILDKVQNIFSYVATQTLYQYVNEPSVPALNGGLNFMLSVPNRTLTININDDGRTTKEDVISLVKVFTGVLKKKLDSKFDVKIDDKSDINMGRLDSNRFDMDVVVNLKTANPNDITDLGDDERIKARK